MYTTLKGTVWKYGDNIDTDVIIPARYLSTSVPEELAPHCMEDIDASFAGAVRKGDLMVAGSNFGCGSSREHAPLALLGCGVSCVVAASFARIFFRNAINVGLPIFECPEAAEATQKGDELEVDMETGIVTNRTRGLSWAARPFPPFLRELIELGGLVPYVKKQLEAS
ncbi:3-isopropylmalate dehydratase small subunit [uncultured Fretibacterium sp.]|uniref:3-isopropylmalate dehydratase small subunit n=1 Tax=uncultured Fretibacterium sp. TaxID=1678694 RepID=UPI002607ECEB|nr:3-isopropylmalate dehydratase small subunit [uncultured Fretibacterium sp.]